MLRPRFVSRHQREEKPACSATQLYVWAVISVSSLEYVLIGGHNLVTKSRNSSSPDLHDTEIHTTRFACDATDIKCRSCSSYSSSQCRGSSLFSDGIFLHWKGENYVLAVFIVPLPSNSDGHPRCSLIGPAVSNWRTIAFSDLT
ncbi:hypothetical protein J6590_037161 [Homalodisca vitripennis]|nr:hypothetical protein J6590_037161 [Homalodisca vitripennis]